jgi:3-phenylpropionate/trans-cinnamate dioxygenase ferredoxin component
MPSLRVASFSSLVPSSAIKVVVESHPLAVIRIQDDVYVIDDTCTHADVSLSEGTVWEDECEIECWKHGTTFSLVTGQPQSLPATKPVRVYTVTRQGDDVMIQWDTPSATSDETN